MHRKDGNVCRHLEKWYQTVVKSRPFLFWVVDTADSEDFFGTDSFQLQYEPSITGDKCHMVITGLSDERATTFAKERCKPPHLLLCAEKQPRQLTNHDIQHLGQLLP